MHFVISIDLSCSALASEMLGSLFMACGSHKIDKSFSSNSHGCETIFIRAAISRWRVMKTRGQIARCILRARCAVLIQLFAKECYTESKWVQRISRRIRVGRDFIRTLNDKLDFNRIRNCQSTIGGLMQWVHLRVSCRWFSDIWYCHTCLIWQWCRLSKDVDEKQINQVRYCFHELLGCCRVTFYQNEVPFSGEKFVE